MDKTRILFVCIGNSCRSQMAEAFARSYGDDILVAASAGLSPAFSVAPDTQRAMNERNLDLRDHFPKTIKHLGRAKFDIAVNLSGIPLPDDLAPRILEWDVPDPIGVSYKEHCEIRDLIERLVMELVMELRRKIPPDVYLRGYGSRFSE
ncbi:MAG TPA: arsenate reductase ArsC [Verrucomicrobiae bacterium]|nr:arsenate reductase ArsC [Verrucomicrobiae bacterium]